MSGTAVATVAPRYWGWDVGRVSFDGRGGAALRRVRRTCARPGHRPPVMARRPVTRTDQRIQDEVVPPPFISRFPGSPAPPSPSCGQAHELVLGAQRQRAATRSGRRRPPQRMRPSGMSRRMRRRSRVSCVRQPTPPPQRGRENSLRLFCTELLIQSAATTPPAPGHTAAPCQLMLLSRVRDRALRRESPLHHVARRSGPAGRGAVCDTSPDPMSSRRGVGDQPGEEPPSPHPACCRTRRSRCRPPPSGPSMRPGTGAPAGEGVEPCARPRPSGLQVSRGHVVQRAIPATKSHASARHVPRAPADTSGRSALVLPCRTPLITIASRRHQRRRC